ncbi:MAG: hypothetical protein ACRD0J_13680 [Acidimicrobiales bacterium]
MPREDRTFFCHTCQLVARERWVPAGWYMVERSLGGGGHHLRLGLYCSVDCMLGAGEELTVGEAAHAERLGLPSHTARDQARVVDKVVTLLHQGATVRQAGDALGVPTSTLRVWLRSAGIKVGTTGTLGPPPPRPERPILPGINPVSRCNEAAQAGLLSELSWATEATGPPHAPSFTVTVRATWVRDGRGVSAQGQGSTKVGAKAVAAAELLEGLGPLDT